MGKRGIFHGKKSLPFRFTNNNSPMACPMNWIKILMANMASITSFNLNNKLNTKAIPPNTKRDLCGKFKVGCVYRDWETI